MSIQMVCELDIPNLTTLNIEICSLGAYLLAEQQTTMGLQDLHGLPAS